jgi:hypothetical protein
MKSTVNYTPTETRIYDTIFYASSVFFNIAVGVLYLSIKYDNPILLKLTGIAIVLISLPFAMTFVKYIKFKNPIKKVVFNAIILVYFLIEILFDYVLKIPFREILWLHIAYIILFYAASYSMIVANWKVSWIRGAIVLITFILLIFCLIHMYS